MPKRLTTEEFIRRARSIHDDRYDYSDVKYVSGTSPIQLICKKHGPFLQKPSVHLRGFGCIQCRSDRNRVTTEEFVNRARKSRGDRYDYSCTKYVRSTQKVKIRCKVHGIFEQLPDCHVGRDKCGCPKCYQEEHRTSTRQMVEEFKERHGNFYDYSKSKYTNQYEKITITCPIHGDFVQYPYGHRSGQGCPKCTSNVSHKEIEFLSLIGIPESDRQKRISRYLVDGIDFKTNTVYEFLGDYWHGNPTIHPRHDVNHFGKTFGELYEKTIERFARIKSMGYNIRYIWECDWDNWKKCKAGEIPLSNY